MILYLAEWSYESDKRFTIKSLQFCDIKDNIIFYLSYYTLVETAPTHPSTP